MLTFQLLAKFIGKLWTHLVLFLEHSYWDYPSCLALADNRAVFESSSFALWSWCHRTPWLAWFRQSTGTASIIIIAKNVSTVNKITIRTSRKAKFLSRFIWHANTGFPAACANPDKCICWLKNSIISSSVTPNGMLPTYNRLAWRVIVLPTTGTAACGVSATMFAGICPAACIALYCNTHRYWALFIFPIDCLLYLKIITCNGVMCSKPGGGTSQYNDGFLRLELLLFFGEVLLLRASLVRSLERDRERFLRSLLRDRCLRSLFSLSPRSLSLPSLSWRSRSNRQKIQLINFFICT